MTNYDLAVESFKEASAATDVRNRTHYFIAMNHYITEYAAETGRDPDAIRTDVVTAGRAN